MKYFTVHISLPNGSGPRVEGSQHWTAMSFWMSQMKRLEQDNLTSKPKIG